MLKREKLVFFFTRFRIIDTSFFCVNVHRSFGGLTSTSFPRNLTPPTFVLILISLASP